MARQCQELPKVLNTLNRLAMEFAVLAVLAVEVVGLVGLVSTCVDAFSLITAINEFSIEYE